MSTPSRTRPAASSRALRDTRKARRSFRAVVEGLEDRVVLDSTLPIGGGQPIALSQPSLAVHYIIATQGAFPISGGNGVSNAPYIGEVLPFAGTVAPGGWQFCDGQSLPINQYLLLFSVIGTTYGGTGVGTFSLPDLRGRAPVGVGQGPGLPNVTLGQVLGAETTTLSLGQIPSHAAWLPGGGQTGQIGGDQAFTTQEPSLGLNFIIAVQGSFPSPNGASGNVPLLGEIRLFAGNVAPTGWAFCDGQLLPITVNPALFSVLGAAYGGDGRTNFALPDLRGRDAVGVGQSSQIVDLGERLGGATETLFTGQLPVESYPLPPDGAQTTGPVGAGAPYTTVQPGLGLNYILTEQGFYPSATGMGGVEPQLGDIRLFAGSLAPHGWALCNGQVLSIVANSALFSVLGNTYGGTQFSTFALPNLEGRVPVEAGPGAGLSPHNEGDAFGVAQSTLTTNQLPSETLPLPVLAVNITADQSTVNAGSTAGFTVTVTNTEPTVSVAGDLTLSVPLPALGGGNLWTINPNSPFSTAFTLVGPEGNQVLELFPEDILTSDTPNFVDVTGVPTANGSPTATLSATATLDSLDVTVHNVTSSAAITVINQQPVFTGLSSTTITYGTPTTTLSGTLAVGTSPVANAGVAITLNAMSQTVTTDSSGHFSATFSTAALGVAGSPYPVTYAFAGNATDNPATDTSTNLSVAKAHLSVTAVLPITDIGHGDPVPTPTVIYSGFVNGDTPSVIAGNAVFAGLPTTTSPAGTYTITPSAAGLSAANYDLPTIVPAALNVHPKVKDILVRWGLRAVSLLNMTRDLPFVDITKFEVRLTDPVNVTGTGLSLTSTAGGPQYTPALAGPSTATSDLNWTLPTAIGIDRLMLQLDQANIVSSIAPSLSLFGPSRESFSVLPGDVNGDGVVNSQDLATVQGEILGVLNPTSWADVDGTCKIDGMDYTAVNKWLGSKLS
jgi:microcystin-dependent protein